MFIANSSRIFVIWPHLHKSDAGSNPRAQTYPRDPNILLTYGGVVVTVVTEAANSRVASVFNRGPARRHSKVYYLLSKKPFT